MPAPTRPAPIRTESTSLAVPKGISGYYTDLEVDALVAGITGGGPAPDLSAYATTAYVDGKLETVYTKAEVDQLLVDLATGGTVDLSNYATVQYVDDALAALPKDAITVHTGTAPTHGTTTPQGVEGTYAGLDQGLHFYPEDGTLITIVRQEFQTTIVRDGPVRSVARIVRSAAGLPTPENPSTIVSQSSDGKFYKSTGDKIDFPFSAPLIVDVFALSYTSDEVDALLAPITTDLAALASNQGQQPQTVDLDLINSQLQSLATVTQGVMDKVDTKADKTAVASLGTTLMNTIMEVKDGAYTKPEVDAAIAGVVTGDLSQEQIDAIISQVGPVDLTAYAKAEDVYTKTEGDGRFLKSDDFTPAIVVLALNGQDVQLNSLEVVNFTLGDLAIGTGGGRIVTQSAGGPENTVAYLSDLTAPPSVDLSAYAKLNDNAQNVVANAMVAKGYAFGDSAAASNPGLVYTDTGEGYGPRLALDTPGGVELIPYQSDFAPIRSRLDALESKAAPGSGVQDVSALASKESVDLLRSQLQTIFDSIYTRPEADARFAEKATTYTKTECDSKFLTLVDVNQYAFQANVYTQRQADDRFMRIDQAFSKTDFDNQMALSLYSRKQVDDKLAAINPLSAPSINDPALAEFKASVMDEVRRMMAGGKTIPADVPWTKLLNTGSTVAEAKVLNGVVYLRGIITKGIGAGYIANVSQLPPTIPPPPGGEWVIPLACKNTSPAVRAFGYATFQPNRQIGVSCDSSLNTVWLDGISYPAYE
jgi:hypothetical protein